LQVWGRASCKRKELAKENYDAAVPGGRQKGKHSRAGEKKRGIIKIAWEMLKKEKKN